MNANCLKTFAVAVACLACVSSTVAAEPTATADAEASVDEQAEQTPELVSLELWILTLSDVVDAETERLISPLLARIGNLPTVAGSRDDVRALIHRLDERNAIRKLQNYQLTALSGREASIVASERKPRITGVTFNKFGQTNTVEFQQIGMAIYLIPSTGRDGEIRVNIKLESSDMENSHELPILVPEKGEATYPPIISSSQVATVASVQNGEAVLIARTLDSTKHAAQLVILSAETVKPAGVAKGNE